MEDTLGEMTFADRVALAMIEVEMSYEKKGGFLTVADLASAADNFCLPGDKKDQAQMFMRLKEIIEAMNEAHEET
jgi:hypothetical protein